MEKPYKKGVAERLLSLLNTADLLVVEDDGVWLAEGVLSALECGAGEFAWNPQCALLESDPQEAPLLPIPFSAIDLAAFLLCPVVADWDEHYMRGALTKVQDGFASQAFDGAISKIRRAEQHVGAVDDSLDVEADRLRLEYHDVRDAARERLGILDVSGHGLDDEEYRRRINAANEEASTLKDAMHKALDAAREQGILWRNRMVQALFHAPVEVQTPRIGKGTQHATDALPEDASQTAQEWKRLAQDRAREIIRDYEVNDWYPSQKTIADTIASEFRRDGIMGTDGKPPSGATIKRHALKGISSARGRKQSVAPHRGK